MSDKKDHIGGYMLDDDEIVDVGSHPNVGAGKVSQVYNDEYEKSVKDRPMTEKDVVGGDLTGLKGIGAQDGLGEFSYHKGLEHMQGNTVVSQDVDASEKTVDKVQKAAKDGKAVEQADVDGSSK